jgi:hypothetical protein
VWLLSWGIRLAVGDQPIDSFHGGSTGNLWALLNADGSLATPLRVGKGSFGFVRAQSHPVTGIPLAGVVVPRWRDARALALRAAAASTCFLRSAGTSPSCPTTWC